MKNQNCLVLSVEYVIHPRGHIVEHNEYSKVLQGNDQKAQKMAKDIHDELVATRKIQGDGHSFTLITILFGPKGLLSVSTTGSAKK